MIEGNIRPRGRNILGYELEFGEQMVNGIITMIDDRTVRGVRPRWCKVFAVGPDVTDVKPGDYVLLGHGEWSTGFEAKIGDQAYTLRWLTYEGIFGVQNEKPFEYKAIYG